jgi:hypothetical protein
MTRDPQLATSRSTVSPSNMDLTRCDWTSDAVPFSDLPKSWSVYANDLLKNSCRKQTLRQLRSYLHAGCMSIDSVGMELDEGAHIRALRNP